MKTPLLLGTVAALYAAPLSAQTSLNEEPYKSLLAIVVESSNLRGNYGEILTDVGAGRITPQYAAPDIVRLARRLNVQNNREQYLMRHMTRDQRRFFKQSVRSHERFNKSLQQIRRSFDGLRSRLERLHYYDSIKLKEACQYFDKISKESYFAI